MYNNFSLSQTFVEVLNLRSFFYPCKYRHLCYKTVLLEPYCIVINVECNDNNDEFWQTHKISFFFYKHTWQNCFSPRNCHWIAVSAFISVLVINCKVPPKHCVFTILMLDVCSEHISETTLRCSSFWISLHKNILVYVINSENLKETDVGV